MDAKKNKKGLFLQIFLSLLVIFLGCGTMLLLANLKGTPTEITSKEKPLPVEVEKFEALSYPVNLKGYGLAKPNSVVSLPSEVNGTITFVNPDLKSGKIVYPGEILVVIDDLNYSTQLCKAEADVEELKLLIETIETKQSIDISKQERLGRNKDLLHSQFEQRKILLEKHKIGSKFDLDSIERSWNLECSTFNQLIETIQLYPKQIREAKAKLKSAEAALHLSKTNLEKCKIKAPFLCRVKSSSVEVGEFVSVGQEIAIIVDDSILEIEVSLDSDDVRRWIKLDPNIPGIAWFGQPEPVDCKITWGRNASFHVWKGKLDRIAGSDQNSHTTRVVVKVDASTFTQEEKLLPLVEDMFCCVIIPGKLMKDVYCLPRQAVTFNNKVHICNEDNRLEIVKVNVVRSEEEYVFVDKGLDCSQWVIKTRLSDPIENTLLEVKSEKTTGN